MRKKSYFVRLTSSQMIGKLRMYSDYEIYFFAKNRGEVKGLVSDAMRRISSWERAAVYRIKNRGKYEEIAEATRITWRWL
jgi:hypothetical protein